MTNLTKQEIQDAREWLNDSSWETYRKAITVNGEVETISKALDIAEKQVWLPISEAPKDGKMVTLKLKKVDKYGAEFEYLFDGYIDCNGAICNDCGDTSEFKAKNIMEWRPLPTPPSIKTRSADVETLPTDAFDFSPEEGTVILETSIAGSTLSDVAKKAGKSASDKVKLSRRG